MNEVSIVTLYRAGQVWVYDAPEHGRIAEVLVPDISNMIDYIFHSNGIDPVDHYKGFDMMFGPFLPKHSAKLERVSGDVNNETGHGNVFKLQEIINPEGYLNVEEKDITGWLCPALFDYFKIAPNNLYVSLGPIG